MSPTDAGSAVSNTHLVLRDHFHERQRRIDYSCSAGEALAVLADEVDCHIRQEVINCFFRDSAVEMIGGQVKGTTAWSYYWSGACSRWSARIDVQPAESVDRVRVSVCAFQ